ncbi:hypothetical protein Z949_761 [Sulfitobacter guttiformis KCTC 32187]|nr:hypothetical protein Z949_761 [Sulfitobacter guttiformis KCTC 32187]
MYEAARSSDRWWTALTFSSGNSTLIGYSCARPPLFGESAAPLLAMILTHTAILIRASQIMKEGMIDALDEL